MLMIAIYIMAALPIIFGNRPVVVLSGSMEPNYPVGSLTYYHAVDFEDISVGDAITFRAGESLITHRVEEKNDLSRTFVTKGDNNETQDMNPVEENALVGKTSKIAIPYLGYFIGFGKDLKVILVMGMILLLSYLIDAWSKKGNKHEDANVQ